jgi:predicted aconitase with swiveling domain
MTTGARFVVGGAAAGPVVVLDEPLSFWGGFSAERGIVTDEHHPQAGVSLAGAVVVMVGGRGSSSASSVLTEAVRLGTAPAAILMQRADEILVTGSLVARELYGRTVPIVLLDEVEYRRAAAATAATLTTDGSLIFT